MNTDQPSLEQLSVNTIRLLSVDAVQQANSGHPGLPLGAAPMAYVLFSRFLRFNPRDPHWPDRDRFVLSAGHGSALLYSLLHLYGYELSLEDLKNFRQLHSRTPGHPESNLTAGVEVTTGPLGQGFANGVGMAMAEAFLAATYNREGHTLQDHYTYSIVSDGDLMEGMASEAASLAGHLRLGKLIYLYDDNLISLDGPTNLTFTEDRMKRFDAYGWHTQQVADGNDLGAIEAAIQAAQAETERPSIIAVRTIIGYGSPQQGSSKTHGSPLGEENLRKAKEFFGFDPDQSFVVPDGVRDHLRKAGQRGAHLQADWQQRFEQYKAQCPTESQQFTESFAGAGTLPADWDADLPQFTPADGDLATRQASGKALLALKKRIPYLFGGSADLASSNDMPTKDDVSFQPDHYANSNVWFGVREHAMGAAINGMSQHGGVRPYGGTFLNFSDYMRGAIRLTALAESSATFVFTHDSIGLGEDGPTHQPVEQVIALRTIPNIVVLRPADANETVWAWRVAMNKPKTPVVLILSRQKLPVLDQTKYGSARGVEKGAYILSEADGTPQLILIATGSEVSLVLKAQAELKKQGIPVRVISMPSWELFEQQDQAYHHQVLPPLIRKRLAVEAGSPIGWHKYVTDEGTTISINRFGLSGSGEDVMAYFGFTVENVVEKAKGVLSGRPDGIEKKEVLS